jgi:pseudouridine-5'-phosphate glycosidase
MADPSSTAIRSRLALESTFLLHGVPAGSAVTLAEDLAKLAVAHGAEPVLFGLRPQGEKDGKGGDCSRERSLSKADLAEMLASDGATPKLNTASLGAAIARGTAGATTVSTTMELAAAAGVRVFATGGLGGVHKHLDQRLDISTDLLAFTRFPVAVVTAGCKSILDVINTRELLETLGVPVIGFRCDRFPAFYRREAGSGGAGVDARFDEIEPLAKFVRRELARTCRGVVICNPIPVEHELAEFHWAKWLEEAERQAVASGATGRAVTPAVLGALHKISGGATLAANIELVKHNVAVGAQLAAAIGV